MGTLRFGAGARADSLAVAQLGCVAARLGCAAGNLSKMGIFGIGARARGRKRVRGVGPRWGRPTVQGCGLSGSEMRCGRVAGLGCSLAASQPGLPAPQGDLGQNGYLWIGAGAQGRRPVFGVDRVSGRPEEAGSPVFGLGAGGRGRGPAQRGKMTGGRFGGRIGVWTWAAGSAERGGARGAGWLRRASFDGERGWCELPR